MDPTKCLEEIREILQLRDRGEAFADDLEECLDKIADLDGWLSLGGFPPHQWGFKED